MLYLRCFRIEASIGLEDDYSLLWSQIWSEWSTLLALLVANVSPCSLRLAGCLWGRQASGFIGFHGKISYLKLEGMFGDSPETTVIFVCQFFVCLFVFQGLRFSSPLHDALFSITWFKKYVSFLHWENFVFK